jgi:hypothetical protein
MDTEPTADPGGTSDPGFLADIDALPPSCDPCGDGSIVGTTCAPNSTTMVPDVTVWVDAKGCDGVPVHISVQSSASGAWRLDGVPCGLQTVNYKKGSFTNSFQISVSPGVVSSTPGGDKCFGHTMPKTAVVTGDWDQIENLLRVLKIIHTKYDAVTGASDYQGETDGERFLADASTLDTYNLVFIDCGWDPDIMMQGSNASIIQQNLQDFVRNGGNIYGSDYAWAIISATWPFFANGGGYQAPGNTNLNGEIIDTKLAAYVGKNALTVVYGLGPLNDVESAGTGTTVHVQSNFTIDGESPATHERPVVMSFQPYPTGGWVIYTTFHYDEQTSTVVDMEKILSYMVFML